MLILAHRGAHEPESPGLRENTLDAFRAAVDLGADGVEVDVRRTLDGALAVHHDAAVPGGTVIAEAAAGQLPPWVPTLGAVLGVAGIRLCNVEIKNLPYEPSFDPDHRVARDVAAAVGGREGVLVSSFTLESLDAFHATEPGTPTGWLTFGGQDQLAAVRTAAERGHRGVHVPDGVATEPLVSAARGAGLQVVVWTVDDPRRMEELAGMGVAAVVTDRPALAVSTLR